MAEVVACDVPDEAFIEAAEAFEGFTRALTLRPRRMRAHEGRGEGLPMREPGVADRDERSEFCPVSGLSNPLAPPLRIVAANRDVVTGVVSFPASFEGPPGLAHGGYVAAALEELLGRMQIAAGRPGTRGTLFVRFRNPCPLNTELRMEARVSGVERRAIMTKATMYAGDQLIAEAEGMGRNGL
jgi:acyl-coenzyme A thioesterase PaaI-like protein